ITASDGFACSSAFRRPSLRRAVKGRVNAELLTTSPAEKVALVVRSILSMVNNGERHMMRFGLAVLAYAMPTFVLGYIWHLVLFEDYYRALRIYRDDIIIPFGLLSILIQGSVFAWIHARAFGQSALGFGSRMLLYGGLGAILSWSFTTLAVGAKNVMTSVPS